MHKLQRTDGPKCLTKYRHGKDKWEKNIPTPKEKDEIWQLLNIMQGERCAYCEADITSDKRKHIEHFRQRDSHLYPQGAFEWTNIFGSCGRTDSCGKHKDDCGKYEHKDLIKPDVDDPEHFFHFHSDGTITLRQGLNENEQHRARETLRIFNLNAEHGALRARRKIAAHKYRDTAKTILELVGDDPAQAKQLLQEEINATSHLPFATAIKHTLLDKSTG